jgi:hypothetical protein
MKTIVKQLLKQSKTIPLSFQAMDIRMETLSFGGSSSGTKDSLPPEIAGGVRSSDQGQAVAC